MTHEPAKLSREQLNQIRASVAREREGRPTTQWHWLVMAEDLLKSHDAITSDLAAANAENERLTRELEEAKDMLANWVTSCVYCGEEWTCSEDTYESSCAEHDKICEKHPLRELERELSSAQQRLAALAVDPTKRDELVESSYAAFKGALGRTSAEWPACTHTFRTAFTAAVEHAFARGRASLPEVAELERQLAEATKRLAELTKPADDGELASLAYVAYHKHLANAEGHDRNFSPWESLPEASRRADIAATQSVAARVRAPLLQQIAELKAGLETLGPKVICERSHYDAIIAAHDRLDAELSTTKQALADARGEVGGVSGESFSIRNRRRCESSQGFNHALSSWSLSDWTTATTGELGEAANIVKKLNRVRDGIPGNKESESELREGLAEEIADVAIYLDLMAQAAGFDLETIREAKFAKTSAKIGYVEQPAAPAPANPAASEAATTRHVIRACLTQEPEGGFCVRALNLPGAISQGETEEEAIANIKDAAIGVAESYRADGEPIPWLTAWEVPDYSKVKHVEVEIATNPTKNKSKGAASEPDDSSHTPDTAHASSSQSETAERRFVCPECGNTELWHRNWPQSLREQEKLSCHNEKCAWSGTWAEVEAAKGEETKDNRRLGHRQIDDLRARAFCCASDVNDALALLNDRDAILVELQVMKRQLAAANQAREAERQKREQAEAAAGVMKTALTNGDELNLNNNRGVSIYDALRRLRDGSMATPDNSWFGWAFDRIDKALTTAPGRAANELRALRAFFHKCKGALSADEAMANSPSTIAECLKDFITETDQALAQGEQRGEVR